MFWTNLLEKSLKILHENSAFNLVVRVTWFALSCLKQNIAQVRTACDNIITTYSLKNTFAAVICIAFCFSPLSLQLCNWTRCSPVKRKNRSINKHFSFLRLKSCMHWHAVHSAHKHIKHTLTMTDLRSSREMIVCDFSLASATDRRSTWDRKHSRADATQQFCVKKQSQLLI